MGDAGRKRPAPEGNDRHRHQGRSVRHHDHRHLRSSDLGQAGLAAAARQSRRRLRRRRPFAGHPLGSDRRGRQAVCRAVLRRKLDGHVPQGPHGKGRADHARRAHLGVHCRCGAQDDRQEQRGLRHLPARQGRLGRKHGLPDGHRERLRRPLVRREVDAAVRSAGMEERA